jgi:hypothetical protein
MLNEDDMMMILHSMAFGNGSCSTRMYGCSNWQGLQLAAIFEPKAISADYMHILSLNSPCVL